MRTPDRRRSTLPDDIIREFEVVLSKSLVETADARPADPPVFFALAVARQCGVHATSIPSSTNDSHQRARSRVGEAEWLRAAAAGLQRLIDAAVEVCENAFWNRRKTLAELKQTLASELLHQAGSEELSVLFKRLDTDGDGVVTAKEWGQAVKSNQDALARHFGGGTTHEVGKNFGRLDSDHSKDLTWDEFVAGSRRVDGPYRASQALVDAMNTTEGKAQLLELWQSLDSDGDGVITAKEWGRGVGANSAIMSRYFGGQTLDEVGKAFKRLDTDGSGDLTWEEFEAGVAYMDVADRLAHALQTEEGHAQLKALFEVLDADHDGRVTAKEWGRAVSKNQTLMSKYFGGSSLRAIGQAFSRLDVDRSGDLSWAEFVASRRILE